MRPAPPSWRGWPSITVGQPGHSTGSSAARRRSRSTSCGGQPSSELRPWGLSFHVGSQQMDPASWDRAIALAAEVARHLAEVGQPIESLNLGGGLPAQYHADVPSLEDCASAIRESIVRHFGENPPSLAIEPGRYLVAAAGIIESEVILVAPEIAGRPAPLGLSRHRTVWWARRNGRRCDLLSDRGTGIRRSLRPRCDRRPHLRQCRYPL